MVVQMLNTGREGVALDAQVAAVAHVDLVDLVEEVLGGVRGEDIGEAGVHAHAQQREPAAASHCSRHRELVVAQLHAGLAGTGAPRPARTG